MNANKQRTDTQESGKPEKELVGFMHPHWECGRCVDESERRKRLKRAIAIERYYR